MGRFRVRAKEWTPTSLLRRLAVAVASPDHLASPSARPCPHSPSASRRLPRLCLPSPAHQPPFTFAVRPSHTSSAGTNNIITTPRYASPGLPHLRSRTTPLASPVACPPRPSPRLRLALASRRRPLVCRSRITSHSHNTDVRLLILNGVGCRTSVRVWGSPDNTNRGVQSTCKCTIRERHTVERRESL